MAMGRAYMVWYHLENRTLRTESRANTRAIRKVTARLMAAISNVTSTTFQKDSFSSTRTQLSSPTHLAKFPLLSVREKDRITAFKKG